MNPAFWQEESKERERMAELFMFNFSQSCPQENPVSSSEGTDKETIL